MLSLTWPQLLVVAVIVLTVFGVGQLPAIADRLARRRVGVRSSGAVLDAGEPRAPDGSREREGADETPGGRE